MVFVGISSIGIWFWNLQAIHNFIKLFKSKLILFQLSSGVFSAENRKASLELLQVQGLVVIGTFLEYLLNLWPWQLDVEITAQASELPHIDFLNLVMELVKSNVVLNMLPGVEMENFLQRGVANFLRGQLLVALGFFSESPKLLERRLLGGRWTFWLDNWTFERVFCLRWRRLFLFFQLFNFL